MLEKIKELLNDMPTLKKYKSLKEEWASQNEKIDSQTAMLNARDRKIINQCNEIKALMNKNLSDKQGYDIGFAKKRETIKKLKKEISGLKEQLNTADLENNSLYEALKEQNSINIHLEQEKAKMCKIIDKLNKQIKWLEAKIPKPTLIDYQDYQNNLRKAKKKLKKEQG